MEKQEMEQVLELLKSMQEQLRTNGTKLDKILAEDKTWREKMKAETEAIRAETKANMDTREETMACQEMMEACLECKKPASVNMTPEVAHEQEVPLEDAATIPVGEPRKRRRD
jgi:hypothetical protein